MSGPRPQRARALRAAAVGYGVGQVGLRALRAMTSQAGPPWKRANFRGRTVDLSAGVGLSLGLLGAASVAPADRRAAAGVGVAVAGGAVFGMWDDVAGDQGAKGLAGHLGELMRGHVTTGAMKVAGIGATALLAALVTPPGPDGRASTRAGRLADTVVRTGLIAGSANVANLLDLRPGRALKAGVVPAALLSAGGGDGAAIAAGVLGAGASCLPDDLAERSMLGDCGANAWGAALGTCAALELPRTAQVAVLGGLVALTLASEKVSFSRVIEDVGALAWVDSLGRRA